jgi:hypothetical protein
MIKSMNAKKLRGIFKTHPNRYTGGSRCPERLEGLASGFCRNDEDGHLQLALKKVNL